MIRILAVGRLKAGWARTAAEDYGRRISRFARLDLVEIPDSDPEREGRQILAALGQEPLFCCDPAGDPIRSEDLADLLGREGSLAFCVGGPDGLAEAVLRHARARIAFGRVTLPHELARIVLLEQIYRGYTIRDGHPYHR